MEEYGGRGNLILSIYIHCVDKTRHERKTRQRHVPWFVDENQQNFIVGATCTVTPPSYLYLSTPLWRLPHFPLTHPATHSHQHLLISQNMSGRGKGGKVKQLLSTQGDVI
jgi:hypothetical protein